MDLNSHWFRFGGQPVLVRVALYAIAYKVVLVNRSILQKSSRRKTYVIHFDWLSGLWWIAGSHGNRIKLETLLRVQKLNQSHTKIYLMAVLIVVTKNVRAYVITLMDLFTELLDEALNKREQTDYRLAFGCSHGTTCHIWVPRTPFADKSGDKAWLSPARFQ